MNEKTIAQQQNSNEAVNFSELWDKIWSDKITIIMITSIFAIGSIIGSLMMSDQFKSEVMLAPVDETEGGLAGMLSKFGGLANLAGINIGKKKLTKPTLAFEILKSRFFIKRFIEHHNLLVPLMAAEGWNSETNQLIIDSDDYDVQLQKWVRTVLPPKKIIPSDREVYEKFLDVMSIYRDKDSGLFSISILFYSPLISKQWVDWLVSDLNNHMKSLDIEEAEKSIAYLQSELESTQLTKMQNVFYQLIEEQTKTVMLAKVRSEYVFKTIDPAVVPDEKHSPRRSLIVILTTLLGGILAVVIVLFRSDHTE